MNAELEHDPTPPRRVLLCMWEGGGTVPPEIGLGARLVDGRRGPGATENRADAEHLHPADEGDSAHGPRIHACPNRVRSHPRRGHAVRVDQGVQLRYAPREPGPVADWARPGGEHDR